MFTSFTCSPNYFHVGEGVDGEGWSSSSQTTVHNTMQQMNMAAFHTKHIHIKDEVLRMIIDEKLKRTVSSKATQCRFATDDKSTMVRGLEDKVSVGCGSDTIDVKVEQIKQTRSIGVDHRPSVMSRSSITDKLYTLDVGTNTQAQIGATTHRSTNTAHIVTYPVATNTDKVLLYNAQTETDNRIFQSLGVIKNTHSNTNPVHLTNVACNTDHNRRLVDQNFDFNIAFKSTGVHTEARPKHTWDRGTSTQEIRKFEKCINTQPIPSFSKGVNTEKRTNQMHRGTLTDLPRTYSIGTGDESLDESPLSPGKNISRTSTSISGGQDPTTYGVKVGFSVDKYGSQSPTRTSAIDRDLSTLEREVDVIDQGSHQRGGSGTRLVRKEIRHTTESSLGSSPQVRDNTGSEGHSTSTYSTVISKDSRLASSPGGKSETGGNVYGTTTVISKTTRLGSDRHGSSSSSEGDRTSPRVTSTRVTKQIKGGLGGLGDESGGGSSYTSTITTTESRSGGRDSREQAESHGEYGSSSSAQMMAQMMGGSGSMGGDGSSYSKVTTTTVKSSRAGGAGGSSTGGIMVPKQQQREYMYESSGTGGSESSQSHSSQLSSSVSGMEGSVGSGGGGGGMQFVMETGEGGQTQMKIIRNVETTYVGGNPVMRSSNVVLRTPDG